MNNLFEIQENEANQYYWFDQGFTPQELKWIEDGVSNIPYHRAVTAGGKTEDRKSNIKWIPQTEEWEWLYQKLIQMASEANNQLWNFDLHSAPELIQYTEYEATEFGKYDWHQDVGDHALSIRKVSITVQLSDSTEYEGGDLCFWQGGESLHGQRLWHI